MIIFIIRSSTAKIIIFSNNIIKVITNFLKTNLIKFQKYKIKMILIKLNLIKNKYFNKNKMKMETKENF